jgi:hypothetical protein
MKTIIEILIDNSNSMGPWQVEKNNKEYLLPDGSMKYLDSLDEVVST